MVISWFEKLIFSFLPVDAKESKGENKWSWNWPSSLKTLGILPKKHNEKEKSKSSKDKLVVNCDLYNELFLKYP